MPVTRHERQQRKSGGVASNPEARRIAAHIAKLPDLLKGRSTRPLGYPYKWVGFGSASYAEAGRFTRAATRIFTSIRRASL
jgi:hypothetical protein